ncbi:hypothetical protein Pmani_036537 [Petrolisthes manimaculis]|uniref:Uncharacterized protein n=1 Tax=Petrolisthes manimaculis TaxID=1843537 RepID=A0AAE1NIC0_9EUCA|nr:hypothetical protein Pmani_036537 [Petrolisthes manimaculis]
MTDGSCRDEFPRSIYGTLSRLHLPLHPPPPQEDPHHLPHPTIIITIQTPPSLPPSSPHHPYHPHHPTIPIDDLPHPTIHSPPSSSPSTPNLPHPTILITILTPPHHHNITTTSTTGVTRWGHNVDMRTF